MAVACSKRLLLAESSHRNNVCFGPKADTEITKYLRQAVIFWS